MLDFALEDTSLLAYFPNNGRVTKLNNTTHATSHYIQRNGPLQGFGVTSNHDQGGNPLGQTTL